MEDEAGPVRTDAPRKARLQWMDMLRGSAIVLVMLWHSSAVPVLYGARMPEAVRAVNMFFLPFRMPTLMFLSGLLLPASLRKPLPVYYAGKFAAIGWPYLVFVLLDRLLQGNDNPWWHWFAAMHGRADEDSGSVDAAARRRSDQRQAPRCFAPAGCPTFEAIEDGSPWAVAPVRFETALEGP